ncbi:MAG: glucose-6-phosphate dehydrogenase [Pseudomonadales bacterium]|nr:glucose-6-phosphate dehydrogenase [Pseudomonadales bacterium]
MAQLLPVDDFDLIIFGGSGDLALRKLLPALWHRHCDGQFPVSSRIISIGRSEIDRSGYLELLEKTLTENIDLSGRQELWQAFVDRISYLEVDALDSGTWSPLAEMLAGRDDVIRAVYLATPPSLFGPVARGFREAGLCVPEMRIVLEKPVGRDFESAQVINDEVGGCFAENQIFRIDHYLGKETVQNLLALRFGNAILEPLWRREVIDHVQITMAEDLGVGNRIEFYNDIGALRDMVQNHMLQLVCLVAMEPPSSLDDDAVRDEKIKVLRALKPIVGEKVVTHTVRAQYLGGAVKGRVVPSYAEELGSESQAETFVAMKLEVDNWRWSGVPFFIRTGKRLPAKHSEIVIQFKPVPHPIFDSEYSATQPNRLSIKLQPDEGVKLSIMSKEPGPGQLRLRPVSLNLSFEETFGIRYPDAYERLVIEVLRGNPALFMRRDEVEAAWRWTDGILEGWEKYNQQLESYVAGTWGPTGASVLLDRTGRSWF